MAKYIEFNNVDLTYPNGYHALKNVTFHVDKGEIVSLIGPSGAGKSTILNALPVMYPISNGEIIVKGSKITKKHEKEATKRIRKFTGYIFQSKNVVKERTAFENVMSGYYQSHPRWIKVLRALANTDFYKGKNLYEVKSAKENGIKVRMTNAWYEYRKIAAKRSALLVLEEVGLSHLAFEKVMNLSGGQEQRVALARTLISSPEIILADEPVSALDVINAEKVLTSIREASINHGLSTIINLHHVDLAIKYTDRIIGVNGGRIVWEGTPDKLTPEAIKTIYGEDFNEIDEEFIAESLAAKNGGSKNAISAPVEMEMQSNNKETEDLEVEVKNIPTKPLVETVVNQEVKPTVEHAAEPAAKTVDYPEIKPVVNPETKATVELKLTTKIVDKPENKSVVIQTDKTVTETTIKKAALPRRSQLRKRSVVDLKSDAKRLGVKGYSRAKKAELVDIVFEAYRK